MLKIPVKRFPFLLLTGGAAAIALALWKRRHVETGANGTLKIIFASLPKDEQKAYIIENIVRNLIKQYPLRPVFLYVVPDASAGKEACGRVFALRNRFDSLFQCESRVFETQLYYDLNPLADEREVSSLLAKDISAAIDAERDICRIVLSDGTFKLGN